MAYHQALCAIMKLYLFDRTDKIIHFEDLTILREAEEIRERVTATMSQNEVFVLQIAMLSDCDDVITDITATGSVKISCINTDTVDKYANSKKQPVQVWHRHSYFSGYL